MNFLRGLLSNSTKTDEDLDKFIHRKFTYYLNNSNLLLNFVSDFEDYKTTGRNDNKSKCDECENLYILTSEIFENYISRIKIPFDITIYSDGKEKSNYNNKVLYFFDLKDLNKILQSKNLARSNEDTKILNKKRILCKIISMSFIKIYIIIKSIFQTFNIYGPLIKNKNTINNTRPDNVATELIESKSEIQPLERLERNSDYSMPPPQQMPPQQMPPQQMPHPLEPPEQMPPLEPPFPPPQQMPPQQIPPQQMPAPLPPPQQIPPQQMPSPLPPPQQMPLSGGNGFLDIFSKQEKAPKNEPIKDESFQKLQSSSNVFYSIFVILFENTEHELTTSKNFNADYLTNKLGAITNELLNNKLPDLLNYMYQKKIYRNDFILKNSIIFNDDNFKFLKIKTSDTLENDATFYLKEIEDIAKKKNNNMIDNNIKLQKLEKCFKEENVAFIENYSKNTNLDLTNLDIANSVKGFLQTMISKYFKTRSKLYDSIIKKLITFNYISNEIENINQGLTYTKIIELTEETKDILLDLHINIFELLNSIIYKIRIAVLEKNRNNPTSVSIEKLSGGKTKKKYYKKYYKKTKKYSSKYTSK